MSINTIIIISNTGGHFKVDINMRQNIHKHTKKQIIKSFVILIL